MNKTIKALVLSILVLPASAFALGTVQARSDVPADVYLDGQLMGQAPVDIQRIQPGTHEIRMIAHGTADYRNFELHVPPYGAAISPIVAEFRPSFVAAPVVVSPVVYHPAVIVRPRPVVVRPIVVNRPVVVVGGGRGRGRGWRNGRRF